MVRGTDQLHGCGQPGLHSARERQGREPAERPGQRGPAPGRQGGTSWTTAPASASRSTTPATMARVGAVASSTTKESFTTPTRSGVALVPGATRSGTSAIAAPARRRRATTTESSPTGSGAVRGEPERVGMPARSITSLTPTANPSSVPSLAPLSGGRPGRSGASRANARSSASSRAMRCRHLRPASVLAGVGSPGTARARGRSVPQQIPGPRRRSASAPRIADGRTGVLAE